MTDGRLHGFGSEEAQEEDAQEEAQEAFEEDALGTAPQEITTPSLITFSSDYGLEDEFVGVCHLVIASIAPDVRVVDLAHGIASVRAGSAVLAQSVPYAPRGAVHLAVVDPGVGTDRRGIVVVAVDGSCLVGPDNGLLPPAAEALGGIESAFELAAPRYRLDRVSHTFHGRDVFAPAAARLALGEAPATFGPPVHEFVRIEPPSVEVSFGGLTADVLRTDRYGNVQLAALPGDLVEAGLSGTLVISCPAGDFEARVGKTFADVAPRTLVVYIDGSGQVAIASNGASARDVLQDPERVMLKGNS